MTCIVGLAEKGVLWLGSDSVATGGNCSTTMATPKVFQNGSFLFGCAGTPRHAQLLRTALFNPPKQTDKQSDLEYLVVDVVAHIRKIFADHAAIRQHDTKTESHDSQYLLAYGDRIWLLEQNFQLIDSTEPYLATGCGYQYALGVLGALQHSALGAKLSARAKLELALKEAERNDPFVKRPFHFISLKARKPA